MIWLFLAVIIFLEFFISIFSVNCLFFANIFILLQGFVDPWWLYLGCLQWVPCDSPTLPHLIGPHDQAWQLSLSPSLGMGQLDKGGGASEMHCGSPSLPATAPLVWSEQGLQMPIFHPPWAGFCLCVPIANHQSCQTATCCCCTFMWVSYTNNCVFWFILNLTSLFLHPVISKMQYIFWGLGLIPL